MLQAGIFWVLSATRLVAVPIAPVGGELAVSNGGAFAIAPAAAVAPDGGFTVVWQQYTDTTDEWDVYQRRYDREGNPLAGPSRVNASAGGCQSAPAIAADAAGTRVIAWESDGRVVFRRFAAGGSALDPGDVEADALSAGTQRRPVVASSSVGDTFLLAWQGRGAAADASDWGIYARVFGPGGSPVAPAALVNGVTSGAQHSPAAAYALGAPSVFAVTWQSQGQDGSGAGVYWRRVDTAGAPLGTEQLVGTSTSGSQRAPRVAADASGNVIVLWETQAVNGPTAITGRRFNSSGTSIGGEVAVSVSSLAASPAVASAIGGDFLAAWALTAPDGEVGLLRRGFDHRSIAFEIEQMVTAMGRVHGAAAAGGASQLVLAWSSTSSGQPPAVLARRLLVSGLDFFTVPPCRIIDTRNPPGPLGGPALQSGVKRTFALAGVACGIPPSARALSINVTAVPGTQGGLIKLYVGDAPEPTATAINFDPAINRANNAVLLLSRDGAGALAALADATVDMVVDVNGYFE
jgi:hypothetical protein